MGGVNADANHAEEGGFKFKLKCRCKYTLARGLGRDRTLAGSMRLRGVMTRGVGVIVH